MALALAAHDLDVRVECLQVPLEAQVEVAAVRPQLQVHGILPRHRPLGAHVTLLDVVGIVIEPFEVSDVLVQALGCNTEERRRGDQSKCVSTGTV